MTLEFPEVPLLYGMFAFLGTLVAGLTVRSWKSSLPLPPHLASVYYFSVLSAAVVGAYSVMPLHFLFGWRDVRGHSLMTALFFGWFTAEGIKASIGLRVPTGDPLALGLAGGIAVARLGCLFGHCCLGIPYHGPFALIHQGSSYAPIPLLETFFHGSAAVVLLHWIRTGQHDGERFRVYVFAYCIFRFITEYYRPHLPVMFGLTLYQVMALILGISIIPHILPRRALQQVPQ